MASAAPLHAHASRVGACASPVRACAAPLPVLAAPRRCLTGRAALLAPVSSISTPRHHNPGAAPPQHDKNPFASLLPTADIFGGAYIPELAHAPLVDTVGERVQRGHSAAADRDTHTPPSATFVGHAAAAATPGAPGTPGSSTPRGRGYPVIPPFIPHGFPGGTPPAGSRTPRSLDEAFSTSTHRTQDEGGPAGRPSVDPGHYRPPLDPRRNGAPLTPRSSSANGLLTPRSRGRTLRTNNSGRDRSITPEKRDSYVATKGGWIQTSVTISDMNIAAWTQQKQDMFIEAVAATAQVSFSSPSPLRCWILQFAWGNASAWHRDSVVAHLLCGLVPDLQVDVQVGLCDVCVLALKEKCGRRLLSIATEITFQVRANSGEHAREIVRELKSQALDNMMLQANIRYLIFTARQPGRVHECRPANPTWLTDNACQHWAEREMSGSHALTDLVCWK